MQRQIIALEASTTSSEIADGNSGNRLPSRAVADEFGLIAVAVLQLGTVLALVPIIEAYVQAN